MTFPVPEQTGPLRRSIAERDRTVVFATAVASLVPGSLLLAPVIDSPWMRLLATFLCCYASVVVVVLILRNRFLRRARTSTWDLTPTSRPLSRKSLVRVDELSALGFTVTSVAVVVDDKGAVFTKPLVLAARIDGQHVAIASAHGIQILSELSTGHWLVTADTKVVAHPTVIAQTVQKANAASLVSTHETGLSLLGDLGIYPVPQSNPMASALHLELLEQQILRQLHAEGTSPRSALLLERGAVLTDGTIRSRIHQNPEGSNVVSAPRKEHHG